VPKKMHMRRDYNMRLQSRSCWKSSTVTMRALHSKSPRPTHSAPTQNPHISTLHSPSAPDNKWRFDVLILSPFVAGVGLTIVEANHVIHYGRWWNPAVEAQATESRLSTWPDKGSTRVHSDFGGRD
jgi:hypothetical protein